MTSKEALESYYSNLLYGNGGFQTDEEELEALNSIKQDLKRLEQLEKENEELKYRLSKVQSLEDENRRMFGENQKLQKELATEKWKGIQFLEEIKKLKIAIKILKEKSFVLEFGLEVFKWNELEQNYFYEYEYNEYDCDGYFQHKLINYILTQQEYELLKEVLE